MKQLFLFLMLFGSVFPARAQSFNFQLTGNPVNTTGWVMTGNGVVSGNALSLTTNSSWQAGSIYYGTPKDLTNCSQFTVSFDFNINGPADGIAFYYISNPPTAFISAGGIGLPTNPIGLLLLLDTWDNDNTLNNPLVSLRLLNGTSNYIEGSTTGLLTPDVVNQGFIKDGAWHTCVLTYYLGAITVAFDGNAPIMTATANLSQTGYFGFSASTGLYWATHSIKNVHITGAPVPPAPAGTDVTYCQGQPAVPLISTGTNLKWYTTPTGGTASNVAPTPGTSAAGTFNWYVSQGIVGCSLESQRDTITVTVTPKVTPLFTIPAAICSGSTAPLLPTTSNNGITGTWAPSAVSNTTTGTYTFTPTAGLCATTTSTTITVTPNVTPLFTIPAAICSGSTAPLLPTTSNNGITGTWAPSAVSNTTTGTYTFTPTAGLCATTTSTTITVTPNVTPLFTIPAAICSGSTAPLLPTTSNNGITGTWAPSAVSNTTTGTYTFTPTAGLCATTTSTTITVTPNVTPLFTIPAAICSGSTAPLLPTTSNNGITGTWAPSAVSNTTTGTYTFTPSAGLCAATTSTTITVTSNVTPVFSIPTAICNGSTAPLLPTTSNNGITGTWAPSAVSNTTTGTYTFTPTAGLCATTTSTTITVTPNVTPLFTIPAAICNGSTAPLLPTTSNNGITGTWAPSAVSNTTTGTYTFTPSAGSCAMPATFTVTVKNPSAHNDSITVCSGQLPYTWNGIANANTGTLYTATAANGCDSIVTLKLTVTSNVTPVFSIPTAICNGSTAPLLPATSNNGITGTWAPSAVSNTTTGTYTFTPSAGSCAMPATFTVTVKNPSAHNDSITVCSGQLPYTWNGIANANTGTLYTATAANGCDSIVTLKLTVTSNVTPTFTLPTAICNGSTAPLLPATSNNGITGTWAPSAVSNTTTGTYTFTPSAGSCAMPATFTVTVKNPSAHNDSITVCSGQLPYTWNGIANANTGTLYTATAANGCDSIVTLKLTVTSNVTPVFSIPTAICNGSTAPLLPTTSNNGITGTWAPSAVSNTTTGTYTFTPSAGSCAMPATFTVTVKNPSAHNDSITVCSGQLPYTWNGIANANTGTLYTATAANGCDSIVTLKLTVKAAPVSLSPIFFSNCNFVPFNGNTYTRDTVLKDTLYNSIGCDSIYRTVNIKVLLPSKNAIKADICSGETYTLNGLSYQTSGNYTNTYTASNGCDSMVILNLTVHELPDVQIITPVQDSQICIGDNITLEATGAAWYEWHFSNQPALNGNPATFRLPASINTFTVKGYSSFNCSDTANITVKAGNCCGVMVPNAFSPNGDGLNDKFGAITERRPTVYQLVIFDRWGKSIFESYNINDQWDGTIGGKAAALGVYFFTLRTECIDGSVFYKKGDITLVR